MSLIGLYPCVNVSAPTELSFFSASMCSVLSLTAITGNLLIVLAVIFDPNRNLQSPFSFLVANLALADLIVGVIAEPMSVDFYIREGLGDSTISIKSHIRRISYFISCTASLLSLAALTVDRFVAITYPMQYRAKLSPKRTGFVSLGLWTISVSCSFLYFEVGYLKYQFVFANTAVISTFLVLVLTYVKVFKTFKAQVKRWDDLHDSSIDNQAKKQAIKWEKKVTKAFLVMLLFFIACFLPSLVLIYIISFCGACSCEFIHWARDLNYYLIMANSSMNPFVFAWRLETYRNAFVKIIRSFLCKTTGFKMRMRSMSDSSSSTKEAGKCGVMTVMKSGSIATITSALSLRELNFNDLSIDNMRPRQLEGLI